ncbi:hypothetical protein [Wenyingzhuangia sp. IMCC45467]
MNKTKKQSIFKFNKKRDSVFLIFVLGTFLFWFLNKLSKEYSQIVYYPIHYSSLSKEFVFQENPPKELGFRIKGNGFYFLGIAFSKPEIEVSVEHLKRKNKYDYYLANSELKKQVRNSIKENVTLVDVISDTLFVKLGKKSFKKVAVVPHVDVTYHLGYKSFSGYKIVPDSILISGPEMQVSKINEINLETFKLDKVQESIDKEVKVVKPDIPKIDYSHEVVRLKVEVEKITEKTLSVPVQIINAPNGEEIVVYPKKIEVTCLVRLSQFNEVKTSDFLVICDYNKRTSKFMKTEVRQKPNMVSSVKLSINEVEYLILK